MRRDQLRLPINSEARDILPADHPFLPSGNRGHQDLPLDNQEQQDPPGALGILVQVSLISLERDRFKVHQLGELDLAA